jgi:hypothetical protein
MENSDSILNRIIEIESKKKLRDFDVESEISYILSNSKIGKDRNIDIIRERYGLLEDKPKTLGEIGKDLNITRERVRQIEKAALKRIQSFVAKDSHAKNVISTIEQKISSNGGTVNTARLYEIFLDPDAKSSRKNNMLIFLTSLSKNFTQIPETASIKAGFILNSFEKDLIEKTINTAIKTLEEEKKPIEEKAFLKLIKKHNLPLKDKLVMALISLSKKIIRTEKGQLGLTSWREINPKSIRDKTYFVFMKHQKPLHFTDISKHIENLGNKKRVTRQAVHNELIRDERFVLIGRGIYALSEWGYENGVVEEVIEKILIEAGKPLHKDVIIEEVLRRRIVKKTTVLLNLQKDRFERVSRGIYTIKK